MAGHIGSFYFGSNDHIVSADTLDFTFDLLSPTINEGQPVIVSADNLQLFFIEPAPTIQSYVNVSIDFVGNPVAGSLPLEVAFSASVSQISSVLKSYDISGYNWYFDYDNDPTVSAFTSAETTTYTYESGYPGKQYSVRACVILVNK